MSPFKKHLLPIILSTCTLCAYAQNTANTASWLPLDTLENDTLQIYYSRDIRPHAANPHWKESAVLLQEKGPTDTQSMVIGFAADCSTERPAIKILESVLYSQAYGQGEIIEREAGHTGDLEGGFSHIKGLGGSNDYDAMTAIYNALCPKPREQWVAIPNNDSHEIYYRATTKPAGFSDHWQSLELLEILDQGSNLHTMVMDCSATGRIRAVNYTIQNYAQPFARGEILYTEQLTPMGQIYETETGHIPNWRWVQQRACN